MDILIGCEESGTVRGAIKWTVDLWELATQTAIVGVCLENPVGDR